MTSAFVRSSAVIRIRLPRSPMTWDSSTAMSAALACFNWITTGCGLSSVVPVVELLAVGPPAPPAPPGRPPNPPPRAAEPAARPADRFNAGAADRGPGAGGPADPAPATPWHAARPGSARHHRPAPDRDAHPAAAPLRPLEHQD